MVAITDKAVEQLKVVISRYEEQESKSGLALRVFVQGKCGCGSVHYGLGIDDKSSDADMVDDSYGIRLLVDSASVEDVEGAEIDYVDDGLMRKGFVVKGAPGTGCACGG